MYDYYVLKRCKIGLLHKKLRIFTLQQVLHVKFQDLQFRAVSFSFGRPKPRFRAGHFGHARNPARNLDARNLAHPGSGRKKRRDLVGPVATRYTRLPSYILLLFGTHFTSTNIQLVLLLHKNMLLTVCSSLRGLNVFGRDRWRIGNSEM